MFFEDGVLSGVSGLSAIVQVFNGENITATSYLKVLFRPFHEFCPPPERGTDMKMELVDPWQMKVTAVRVDGLFLSSLSRVDPAL